MQEKKQRSLEEDTKGLYVDLPRSLYKKVHDYCFENNMSKAFFVTNLIKDFFEKDGDFDQKDRNN